MLKLRAHHLLCLQGFQGYGYDAGFVDNLKAIHASVQDNPEQVVEVLSMLDSICQACPHNGQTQCLSDETEMQRCDQEVLKSLNIEPGHQDTIQNLFEVANQGFKTKAEANAVCQNCSWTDVCLWYQSRD